MAYLERVGTAGAFVQVGTRFVFVTGPTRGGHTLCVTRLGGHREADETPWDCVKREVLEEAAIHIRHVSPPATYWVKGDKDHPALEPRPWDQEGVAPLVVVARDSYEEGPLTPLYLARTEETPVPSSETQGLLLLTRPEVTALANKPLTLAEHLANGGEALLRPGFPATLPLEPFYHIRVLEQILARHPELME